jgi:hypothetical protein
MCALAQRSIGRTLAYEDWVIVQAYCLDAPDWIPTGSTYRGYSGEQADGLIERDWIRE